MQLARSLIRAPTVSEVTRVALNARIVSAIVSCGLSVLLAGCITRTGPRNLEQDRFRTWVGDTFSGETVQPANAAAPARDSHWGTGVPFSFVYDGKPSSQFLAGWKRVDANMVVTQGGSTLAFACTDPVTGLEVSCELVLFPDLPAAEWVLRFTNTGTTDTPIIESVLPLDLTVTLPENPRAILHYSQGDVQGRVDNYLPVDKPLSEEDDVILPAGKQRAQTFLPYFNLELPGGGLAGGIGWTGQWSLHVSRRGREVRLCAGQQLTRFRLHPGESVRTPRILLIGWLGQDRMRGHNLVRAAVLGHYVPRLDGRVVTPPIGTGTATLNDFTEQLELDAIQKSAGLGVEAYWRDAGWCEGGWPGGAGNWRPRQDLLPRGFTKIAAAAHANGMGFLLCFEPERVTAGSSVAKEHPQWVLTRQDSGWSEPFGAFDGFHDGLFNLGDVQARIWMTDMLAACIRTWGVDILRWDRNTQPVWYWRANDSPDRQGISEIRYVEGLYALWDALRLRFPALIIDNADWRCTGPDLEAMRRTTGSFTCSKTADRGGNPIADQVNTAGLSFWLPLHGNRLHGLSSYLLRSVVTTNTTYCWQNSLAEGKEALVRAALAEIQGLRPLCLGDYYPLLPIDADETHWCAWQFDRPDLGEGVALLFRRPRCQSSGVDVELHALNDSARYQVEFREGFDAREAVILTGRELKQLHVEVWGKPGCMLVHYTRMAASP